MKFKSFPLKKKKKKKFKSFLSKKYKKKGHDRNPRWITIIY